MGPRSVRELDFTPVRSVCPSPPEWRDHIIYHLLIDRFDNNDPELALATRPAARPPRDPAVGARFQGGQIAGITRRLDYVQQLGCSAIWISPPFKNRLSTPNTYHGYGIQNFLEVDPRFGSLDDLRTLIQEAHQRGMYVILDIVINHTGDNWAYVNDEPLSYQDGRQYEFGFWRGADDQPLSENILMPDELDPDDAVWPVELQRPECYKRRGRIADMKTAGTQEMLDGDTEGMKDLDLRREDVRDALIRIYKWWIAQVDCDGFRIDTVKHTEPEATSIFVNAIREYALSIGKLNFFFFAEVVAEDEELLRYVGLNTPNRTVDNDRETDSRDAPAEHSHEAEADQEYPFLAACLDYPLHHALAAVLKSEMAPQKLAERYQSFQHYFRDFGRAGSYFVTFLDSHDQLRNPYYRLMHGESDTRLAVLGVGYLLTSMGIPCIYYGTEQCFDGGSDRDDDYVRESMFGGDWGAFGAESGHFFNSNRPAYQAISAIARLRRDLPVLRYGRQYFQQISHDGRQFEDPVRTGCVFAFSRVLDTVAVVVVVNLEADPVPAYVAMDPKFFQPGTRVREHLTGSTSIVQLAKDGATTSIELLVPPRQLLVWQSFAGG
jgi:glycosidase